MKFYETTRTIDATPETVWQVLIDGPGFAEWIPES